MIDVRLTLCLVGMKIVRMENRGMKIGWKTVFSTVWQKKENAEDRKPGRKFSLLGPQFSSSQIRRKIVERKVLSQHLYKNALIATIITIFLSTISKLKHNQIIRIQTQKHNFKINQKKKDRRQKSSETSRLHCVGTKMSDGIVTHLSCSFSLYLFSFFSYRKGS